MDEATHPGGSPEVAADAAPGSGDEQRSPEEAGKADFKAQAAERVDAVRQNAKDKIGELRGKASDAAPDSAGSAVTSVQEKAKANPVPLAVGLALVGGFAVGRLTGRG
jgi:hypothetical protein